jgi:hypothetical protein
MSFAKFKIILLALILHSAYCYGQQANNADSLINIPNTPQFLHSINKKLDKFNRKLNKRTSKALAKFHKAELKLIQKMMAKDTVMAKAKLLETNTKYALLTDTNFAYQQSLVEPAYNPYIDSVKTFLKLVENNKAAFVGLNNEQLNNTKKYIETAQANLNYTDEVKKYLSTQKESLRSSLQQLNIFTKFKAIEKTAYYYNEYVKEYGAVLKDKKRIENKLMGLLMSNGKVKEFFAQNSMLARLFHIPPSNGLDMSGLPALAGLQTRENINDLMQQRVASGGPNAVAQVKGQIQAARAELTKLKSKLEQYGKGVDVDGQPLSFTPNTQKTKPFAKRLEYGGNIQTNKGNYGFPAMSDLALSLGYNINDKSVLSIGGSYKLGLGQGWDNIKFTSQGIGIRSNLDWKIKGSFFVASGYELNHFYNKNETVQYQQGYWEKAALLGLTKKYKISRKLKGNMQLLYNFLSNQNTNKQPIVFRVGYTF